MVEPSEPLVCICIPNYNNEKTIAETLDSLVNQTYKNIIIKIFDNASTDASLKILREYEQNYNHIHVFESAENIGAEANFTRCIQNMEGDYSAIYHSDDVYLPTIVEEEVAYLQAGNIGAVSTRKKIYSQSGIKQDKGFPVILLKKNYHSFDFKELFSLILEHGNFINTPSVMALTSLYKDYIVEWRSDLFATSSDLDVWLRFSKIAKIGFITKELFLYRFDDSSFSYRRQFVNYSPSDFVKVVESYLVENEFFNKKLLKIHRLNDDMRIRRNMLLNDVSLKGTRVVLLDIDLFYLLLKSPKGLRKLFIATMFKFSKFKPVGLFIKKLFLVYYRKT